MSELKFIETADETIYTDILEELENGVGEPLYPGDERRIFGDTMAKVIVTFVQPWRVTQCKKISCDPSHVQCTRCTGLGQRIVCPVSVPPGFRDNGD